MQDIDIFNSFKPKTALVFGDLMVDVYTVGAVERISPEAPVLILRVFEETRRPGGAGNAILNMLSLGMKVMAFGRVGKDEEGNHFIDMLNKENVGVQGIVVDETFHTPVKKRMMAESQQLLRVDYENPLPLSPELEKEIEKQLELVIDQADVIAISDYAKGFLTESLLQHIISLAKEKNIPVIVDPKGSNFSKYRGATLIKPNLSEAITASGFDKKTSLDLIGAKILADLEIETLMITRSKEGISLFNLQKGRDDFPAFVHEVKDVTGAGDTVLAIVTQTLANRLDLKIGAFLANVAAGIAIERVGCARITLQELSDRLIQIVKRG